MIVAFVKLKTLIREAVAAAAAMACAKGLVKLAYDKETPICFRQQRRLMISNKQQVTRNFGLLASCYSLLVADRYRLTSIIKLESKYSRGGIEVRSMYSSFEL